jgi:hypothetical protein
MTEPHDILRVIKPIHERFRHPRQSFANSEADWIPQSEPRVPFCQVYQLLQIDG